MRVTYEIRSPAAEIESRSRAIAWEQSVEVPESLVPSQRIRDAVVGRVETIDTIPSHASARTDEECFSVCISYPMSCVDLPPSQLMNLAFGNISLLDGIRVVKIELPSDGNVRFPGPRHGIPGIRGRLGVFDRPLLATALKPKGESIEHLAGIAGAFARGGGDVVKDDHNLVDVTFDDFRRRVAACAEAVRAGNEAGGGSTLYLANLGGPVEELPARLEFLEANGAAGFLIAPFLVGLDATEALVRRSPLIAMAHPSWAGGFLGRVHGIAHQLLLGWLPRILGLDATVFPNFGGRFGFTREECVAIAHQSREALGTRRAAWPAPAGGMQLASVPQMAADYGNDAIFLVGGALLEHSPDVADGTAAFAAAIRNAIAGS